MPESTITGTLRNGVVRMNLKKKGSKEQAAEMRRMLATWKGVRDSIPTFMRMKEHPQVRERPANISQLVKLCFKILLY